MGIWKLEAERNQCMDFASLAVSARWIQMSLNLPNTVCVWERKVRLDLSFFGKPNIPRPGCFKWSSWLWWAWLSVCSTHRLGDGETSPLVAAMEELEVPHVTRRHDSPP